MAYIKGIGGFFFRAEDPKKIKQWYVEVLGIDIQEMVWQQEAGPTVFEPFPRDTNHFAADKTWMLNFRVADLKGFIDELKKKGIAIEERDEWNAMPEIGTFARLHDPEGNPIELWQPGQVE